jgi:hypothetical protein
MYEFGIITPCENAGRRAVFGQEIPWPECFVGVCPSFFFTTIKTMYEDNAAL